MPEAKQWYEVGWGPVPKIQKTPRRFYIPRGETRKIVFVDDNPFRYWEHRYFTEERGYRNYVVCTRATGKCAFCEAKLPVSYIGLLTIISLDSWKDRLGKEHKNEVILFPARIEQLQILKLLREKKGLYHSLYSVTRLETEQAMASGDIFEFEQAIDKWDEFCKSLGYDKPVEPFDYSKLVEPLSYEAQKFILEKLCKRDEEVIDEIGDENEEVVEI